MNENIPLKWNNEYDVEMTEEVMRSYFSHGRYRVSKFSYPANTELPGSMRASIGFILKGNCKYSFKERDINLKAEEFSKLPEGKYTLKTGEEELELMLVWELPNLR